MSQTRAPSFDYDGVAYVTHDMYEAIREAAPTEHSELCVRLCGEAGLNAAEVPDVRLSRLASAPDLPGLNWLHIADLDGHSGRQRPRETLLTDDLARLFRRVGAECAAGADAPIFDVTKRTIQKYIKDAAERAADIEADPELARVSSKDLRERWVRLCVERWRIHPVVVAELGGWGMVRDMVMHLSEPHEARRSVELARYGGA